MSKTIEFYFDFGSPTAFLAHKRLQQLKAQYDCTIDYKAMLLGGIFKATGNTSPVAIPAKGEYMLLHDLPRFSKRYQVELKFNPHFPINTLYLMRAALAAQKLDCFDQYVDCVYQAIWQEEKNMGDMDVVANTLSQAGLDAQALIDMSQNDDIKAELIKNTEAAAERKIFGAPTMFLDGEMFFGQDRLDFVEERLQA
ncbi:2-hydroxychromene-2-carboxylate isomerase [Pseudoteredinibacter isoporae]|uniref:2-hydroxychromene-2-carboxylate isomerase n=1 Tax=Pseudoteredinibacter isoporae TaxID=570281 RepID=A0A7X0JUH7_9GAMM|nr:2-hydroxychromene-2-carboxylate isomerase [Pseudoteredinibacter isoporae]MBB6522489.1 2-hydroxychromene-2-carboxylate isomerase [Pseudoteredinibacter isoporae]NHO88018.1 2-hydroxychromene-2-carboxylate isomerase [Pseudoteredinibacter isoporae]NIB23651.1 2-hydroxychromene-2-carboxylate isomerase [Pseudoteredinibacter isoporae]